MADLKKKLPVVNKYSQVPECIFKHPVHSRGRKVSNFPCSRGFFVLSGQTNWFCVQGYDYPRESECQSDFLNEHDASGRRLKASFAQN